MVFHRNYSKAEHVFMVRRPAQKLVFSSALITSPWGSSMLTNGCASLSCLPDLVAEYCEGDNQGLNQLFMFSFAVLSL